MSNEIAEITPMTVPKGYEGIVEQGYKPRLPEDTRQFIIGPNGQGKTTFVASQPDTVILDTEKSAESVPRQRAFRIPIHNGKELIDMVNKLVADGEKGNRPFKRVVFDTIDQCVEYLAKYLGPLPPRNASTEDIRRWGLKGAGYSILTDAVWNMINRIENAGYAWTLCGHIQEQEITINDSTRTVKRPVIYKSLLQVLVRNCDFFCDVHAETVLEPLYKTVSGRKIQAGEKKALKHFLTFDSTITGINANGNNKIRGVPTISRKIELPDVLGDVWAWDVFADAYNTAVAEAKTTVKS